jgi:chromosome segregation ATPase
MKVQIPSMKVGVPGVEGCVEKRLYDLEEEFWRFKQNINEGTNPQHESRLTALENKLEAFSTRMAKFEGALNAIAKLTEGIAMSVNSSKSRRSGGYSSYNQHNSQPAQLEPRTEKQLATRLNSNVATIQEKRATYTTPQEFDRWCRDRDGTQHAWHFNEKDGLYHPVK